MGQINISNLTIVPDIKYSLRYIKMAGRMAVRAAVDWTKLASNIPKSMTAEFNAFRTKHETIKGELNMLPEKPTPVNFDHYLASVKNTALVEQFQAAYAGVTVPYPEDTESAKIEQTQADTVAEIEAQSEARAVRVADYEAEITRIKSMKPYEEISTIEYAAANPDVVAEVEAEFKAIGW